jgi:hypothetical protein
MMRKKTNSQQGRKAQPNTSNPRGERLRPFATGTVLVLGLIALSVLAAGHHATPPPPLVLLSTQPEGRITTLWLARGEAKLLRLGQFDHRPAGDVRATLLDSRTALATAPVEKRRDRSFDTGLWKLGLDSPPRLLARELSHASRPLVHDGEVFVVRGAAGPWPRDRSLMRLDRLTLDRIDPHDGGATTLHTFDGYWLHLAGALDDELFLYRISENHADIVAVHRRSNRIRVLLPNLPAFARDFSVAASKRQLIFRGRNPAPGPHWQIESLHIDSGQRQRLHLSNEQATAPFAWHDRVVYNPQRKGLSPLRAPASWASPLGPGVDAVEATSSDHGFAAARHTVAGELASAFVINQQGRHWKIPVPQGQRIAIAGFIEEQQP